MDSAQLTLTRQNAELVSQALDVYVATLMCAPLGLGLDLMATVRDLRERLDEAIDRHSDLREAANDPDSNIVAFARA